jgi:ABC-type polysaccharide/polyol phosphate transport system ATPase subunit
MENTIPKDVKDSSNNSEGKITPTKDKDSSSSETKSNPGTPKTNSNSYLNVIQSNNILMSEDNFIGISGLIGAGKTTLAKALGKVLNLPVYYEPIIENE